MKNFQSKVVITFSMTAILLINAFQALGQKAEIGLRIMPTFNSFEITTPGEGRVQSDFSVGFGVGGVLGFNPWEHVGFQGEVIYNTYSQKYKETDVEREINLKYLNIPLLLSLNTGKTKFVNLNVVAGPQIGLSLGSELSGIGSDSSKAVLAVKKGDLGLAYGAGLDFGLNPAKTLRLSIGFRGVFGLFDISDDSGTITTESYYLLDRSQIKTYAGYAGISLLF
jgi:Outer membrane protein beta-barrel domain